jgi:hypothetical protein
MLASADVERVAVGSLTNPQNVRILESILPPEIFQVFIKKGGHGEESEVMVIYS